jgi:hypothetical protein
VGVCREELEEAGLKAEEERRVREATSRQLAEERSAREAAERKAEEERKAFRTVLNVPKPRYGFEQHLSHSVEAHLATNNSFRATSVADTHAYL